MNGVTAFWITYILLLVAGVTGWVKNIVAVIGSDFAQVTGMLVARVIGIVVAPLGAVLGWV